MESEIRNETLIEARHLSRRYGPTLAVADLNLTLRKGEILGLLGPNGAGKSTTLKMLAGCLAPTAGEVRIKGVSLRENPNLAKRHLGYLPEQPPLYPELTVDEYLAFCAGLHGIPRAARAAAAAQAKQACGLTGVSGRVIGNLSKGYQQRVGLAQAIIHRPPVVILDEPTVGLDPIQIREIRGLIAELGRSHSVILSSHILPEIQATCQRVMIVNRGRVVFDDVVSQDMRFDSVAVRLRRAPQAAELAALPGVARVEELGEGRWRLGVAAGADPREAIAEAAVRGGWGLIELRAVQKTLEEMFVELTSGEEPRNETMGEAKAA
ncbi:MAG: ATP-binding cassette domain-containing protein [Gammaproteobacteria bacterium]|nr:ATP-binding cassette domain-containing protein [Gammaproteobacteria bacterium]